MAGPASEVGCSEAAFETAEQRRARLVQRLLRAAGGEPRASGAGSELARADAAPGLHAASGSAGPARTTCVRLRGAEDRRSPGRGAAEGGTG